MVKLIFVCCVNIKYVVFEKLYKNPPIIKKYPKIRKTSQIYE